MTDAQDASVVVDGARIVYTRHPGLDDRRNILFVHGTVAHRYWWDFVLNATTNLGPSATIDLSGHGDSDHRADGYSPELWAREVIAVGTAAFNGEAFTLVGHSMGGLISIAAASTRHPLIEAIVVIDAKLRRPETGVTVEFPGRNGTPPRFYPDHSAAVESFRLLPPESTAPPDVVKSVAARSYIETPDGWRMRADRRAFQRFQPATTELWLGSLACPILLIGGAHSPLVREENALFASEASGRPVAWTLIEGSHHHVLLDRPVELASLLDAVAAIPWIGEDSTRTDAHVNIAVHRIAAPERPRP